MSSVQNTGAATFQDDVLNIKDTPVIIDFWATWCGPCQVQGPIMDTFAAEIGDKVKVFKVNVDDEGDLAQRYNVLSIPSLKIFKNGELVEELTGVHTKEQLKKAMEKHF